MQPIIIGTDEAGYGPNLGPLVASITAWEADMQNLECLYEPLKHAGIPIDDSKKLYHSGSLATLEASLLASLRASSQESPLERHTSITPIANDEEKIIRLSEKFESILQQHHVRLLDMQYRCVEPKEFNQLLDRFDSKGTLLSNVTLCLIAEQLERLPQGKDIFILCDKHGGRNHYLDILSEFFPDEFIQVVQQSRQSSVYRLALANRKLEFRFVAKGETHLPIALASMLSKYHRELAMIRFNAFWQSHLPDLRPTAGYPEDAKRFKQQIAEVQKRLGIADDALWRRR